MNNKHIRIYLPLTIFILVALSVGAARELTHVHQFRTLERAVSDGTAKTVPGRCQQIVLVRTLFLRVSEVC